MRIWEPYPQLRLTWQNPNVFRLALPWVELEIEASEEQRREPDTLRPTSEFLEFFSAFPVAYSFDLASSTQRRNTAREALESDWDETLLLEAARVVDSDRFDGITLYELLRGLRLVHETAESTSMGFYGLLESLLAGRHRAFLEASRLIVRQTHFITSNCLSAVAPAARDASPISEEALRFMKEERGHERFAAQSLAALGVHADEIESIPVLAPTRRSMEILRFCAEHHPLAFACVVSAFEGTNYAETDPLASVLARSPYPEAGHGLQKHFEINRDLEHSQVGGIFAAKLPSVDRGEALAAIRLTRAIVEAGNDLTRELSARIGTLT